MGISGNDLSVGCGHSRRSFRWADWKSPPQEATWLRLSDMVPKPLSGSALLAFLAAVLPGAQPAMACWSGAPVWRMDAISSGYEAQYDASGNMTCRTPTGPQVCTSSQQTGASLSYDAEGRLIRWVSADGATTVNYGYDGEGHRFEMQVVTGSTTTTTTYISNLEEVTVQGSSTTKIVYFFYNGQMVAEDDNTHWYYPINDMLTSTTVEVDYTGVIAAQLFAPYGQTRWSGGTMPTSYAFTGQRADSATGLDYYNARYYDPAAGAFISADTVLPGGGYDPAGLDHYAYVSDNPVTFRDPSGHGQIGPWPVPDDPGLVNILKHLIEREGITTMESLLKEIISGDSSDPAGIAWHYTKLWERYRQLVKWMDSVEESGLASPKDIEIANSLESEMSTDLLWAHDPESLFPASEIPPNQPFSDTNIRGPIKPVKAQTSDPSPNEINPDPAEQAEVNQFLRHLDEENQIDSDSSDTYGSQEAEVEHFEQVDESVDGSFEATDPWAPPTTAPSPYPSPEGEGNIDGGTTGGDGAPGIIPTGDGGDEGEFR